jgi:hypothetical protein
MSTEAVPPLPGLKRAYWRVEAIPGTASLHLRIAEGNPDAGELVDVGGLVLTAEDARDLAGRLLAAAAGRGAGRRGGRRRAAGRPETSDGAYPRARRAQR